jgi:hypothetical protein
METQQFLDEAKAYATPNKWSIAFDIAVYALLFCAVVTFGCTVTTLLYADNMEETLKSLLSSYWIALIAISLCWSSAAVYYYTLRKSVIKNKQLEYLNNMYLKCDDEINDLAESLQLLRAVPEIAETTITEQEHLDDIKKYTQKYFQIEKAIEELQ